MRTQFSLGAGSLLACGVLFTMLCVDDGWAGQNHDIRPDGRGDRIRGTPPKLSAGAVATGNGINYHNGPVLHTINAYYIWYGDWNGQDPTGPSILTDFISNIGGSSYFNINTTYGDTIGNVPNAVTFANQTIVAGTNTSLTDSDVANIVATALVQFGGIPDTNGVYFVLTAPGVTETSGFLTTYCGWHNHGNFLNGGATWDIKYAFVGNASGSSLAKCAKQTISSPNGDPGADAMVSVIAHELEETATDPDLNAWYDSNGQENADKCAWTFGNTMTESNGSLANMTLGARDYLVQQNWMNAQGGMCALSYVNPSGDFIVSASPSSQTVVQGNAASYTVTVAPLQGFSAPVTLSASGLPPDASATFSPASVSPASWTSTLNITTGPNSQFGSYPITITAVSIDPSLTLSTTVTLVVSPAGFALTVSPSSQHVIQGNGTNYIVTSTPVPGFADDVALSVSGLPGDAIGSLSQVVIAGGAGSSVLNVTTSTSTPPGTYALTVSGASSGTSGTFNHSVAATLGVNAPVAYPPQLDQGGFTNTGSTVTNPQGTLSISGSSLMFLSSDYSMAINATFTSSSLVESCTGSGTKVTCVYTFQGSFRGTLTLNGVPQAINGKTTQVSPTATEIGNGSTAFNSAYTPFYFSNSGQLVRSDDLDGTNLTTYGSQGSGVGQFYGAYGLAVDSSGRIYVADTYNCRIVRIDDFTGTNWTTFGSYGTGQGQFNNPSAISIDAAGKIYVMDTGNARLVRMDDMNGTNWSVSTTGLGAGVGQFAQYSTAVAFDTFGSIYIADTGNKRIVRMDDLAGNGWTTLTQSPVIGIYIYSFASPVGVAVDTNGRIYIADASTPTASVVRVDDMSGANWTQVSLGSGATPHSIAIDPGGLVLVGGGGAQIVDNMMQVLTSGTGLTNGFGAYYVFGATPAPVPAPRPSAISFSPSRLSFSQNVNTTSSPQTITVTNFGGSSINGLSIATSGVFSQSNSCPSTLIAAATCTVTVWFAPTAAGSVAGALAVSDDSYNAGSSQIVPLSGAGTVPGASITPTSLSFAAQIVGTMSSARAITVLSSGTGALQVSAVAVSGPFSQTNNCVAMIAPAASCTIQVSFAPALVGAASGSITITDNAGSQTVKLSGTGSAPVTFSPASLSFGNVVVQTTPTSTITLTNHLNTTLTVNSVTVSGSGPFTVSSNTCLAGVAANATCTVGIAFSPIAVGSTTATLTFADNAATSPQTVNLSGTGVAPVTLSVTSLSFSATVAGNTSAAKSVTLTNNQSTALSISSIATNPPFAIASNTCGTSVLAGKNCTVGVTFSPQAVGAATGTLTFNAVASPPVQTVSLSGTGSAPVTLSATSLSFSTTVAGNTSAAKTVTLTNLLATPLSVTSIMPSGPFAVASNTCGTSVLAGKSCTVGVTFSPQAVGAVTGTLTFADGAVTAPQTVSLTGTGSAPVTFSSNSISFGTVKVGTTSSAKTVTLTNHLSSVLAIASISASAGFTVASNTCGTSIGAGASCTVGVTFSPAATGSVTGTLTFTDSAVSSQQVITLAGTGQ